MLGLQKHEWEMKEIALNYQKFNLSALPDIYFSVFHRNIKSVYSGKLKDLVLYFDEYFTVKHNYGNNQTFIVSKIFKVINIRNRYPNDRSPGSYSNASNHSNSNNDDINNHSHHHHHHPSSEWIIFIEISKEKICKQR